MKVCATTSGFKPLFKKHNLGAGKMAQQSGVVSPAENKLQRVTSEPGVLATSVPQGLRQTAHTGQRILELTSQWELVECTCHGRHSGHDLCRDLVANELPSSVPPRMQNYTSTPHLCPCWEPHCHCLRCLYPHNSSCFPVIHQWSLSYPCGPSLGFSEFIGSLG